MVRRSTWILLAVFVLLVGFAWLFQRYQTKKVENLSTATPTVAAVSVFNINGTQVDLVDISDSSGGKVEFKLKPETNQWSLADEPSDQVDSFLIGSNLAQLFAITAQETITQTIPLDAIGLAFPTFTIKLTTTDGEIIQMYIGSVTPVGEGFYVRVDSGPIIIVDKAVMDGVIDMFLSPPLIATFTPEISTPVTVLPANSGILITSTP
jgi:hypothetical protein